MKHEAKPNLIGGGWVQPGNARDNLNPSDLSDTVGTYAAADAAQVDQAAQAARAAFKTWSVTTPQQRFDILDRAGAEIIARQEELGRLLSREEGKILAEGRGE